MNFLPDGFEKLKTAKPYWKMSEMKEGDNKLRIVTKPIAGWIDWHDKRPVRYRPENKPAKSYDPEKPVKPFWVCYVWDYAREGLYVLEISQSSILRSLTNYAQDEDWGDFTGYDLKLRKEGSGKETKWHVTPLPHKPLSDKIVKALQENPVKLDALYEGGDPWDNMQEKFNTNDEYLTPLEQLENNLNKEGIDCSHVSELVSLLSKEKKKTEEEIIKAALDHRLSGFFIDVYIKKYGRGNEAISA
jgi:hypothetical protein